ncbi:DUF5672 family protein [Mucilaginibacter sp. PAMB04168]|uniref:DUF5672 family protein n=1 Tax=Mucilaginibacter sp. PAMB04168 TaxID=3138567 RepID=UPI0031F71E6A
MPLRPKFYERFSQYEYLLTCHMDAFVFKDELEKWFQMDYEYIGAVIYDPTYDLNNTFFRRITGLTNPEYFGNGGFSLKKVSSFL